MLPQAVNSDLSEAKRRLATASKVERVSLGNVTSKKANPVEKGDTKVSAIPKSLTFGRCNLYLHSFKIGKFHPN